MMTTPLFNFDKIQIEEPIGLERYTYYLSDSNGNKLFYVEQDSVFKLGLSFGVFQDETKKQKLLSIRQEKTLQLSPGFIVHDEANNLIGRIKKRVFSLARRFWSIYSDTGKEIVSLQEDVASIFISLVMNRKNLTNFNFIANRQKLGDLNFNWLNIRHQYFLDLSNDATKLVDRRLALCAAVVLDATEGRHNFS